MMTTQNENPDFSGPEYHDPFPEPNTIPSGWDLSELLSAPQPVPAADSNSLADLEPR